MEKTIKITQCDVCGRKVKQEYSYLQNFGWKKYSYQEDWKSYTHSGKFSVEIVVCYKCNESKRGIKYFFHNFLKGKT